MFSASGCGAWPARRGDDDGRNRADGFPIISSGFYSKDLIMAQTFITAGPGFTALGVIVIITSAILAFIGKSFRNSGMAVGKVI